MANDRKLLTADAVNLKAKVRAEMLRRSRTGSVAAYGGGLALYAVLHHVPVVRYCVFGIKKEKPHVL